MKPLLPALLLAAGSALAADAPRPNIVFLLLDDAGFSDLGAYGSEIETPHIDSIARAGVRFTNFHTASSCESTRVMLQSGVDHHRAGAGSLRPVLADNQRGQPGYEGYLNDRVHSLGQLLRSGGYATYYVGKWNIGDGVERAPGARGWDRYLALEQTGADNFEAKVYAPLNLEARWWEDGKRATLPKDFYSSRHYTDKLMSYIDSGRAAGKPFMAMLSFQAVHSPLQAPAKDIDKYLARYGAGWERIRAARYQRQVAMGVAPAGLSLPQAPQSRSWVSLGREEQRRYARKMAAFAGMLDHADQQIGRLRDYLRRIGQLDNTAFIVMSDNGADPYELDQLNLPFRLWYATRFTREPDAQGLAGSYVHYGQDWAQVSNTPFAMFKGTSGEGGVRVPFIVSYPGMAQPGALSAQFVHVTDFLPTVLGLARIPVPGAASSHLLAPTGKSMLPYLAGQAGAVHDANHMQGFEGTGGESLYRGRYKLSRNVPPYGDRQWHLYDLAADPTESSPLEQAQPELAARLAGDYAAYVRDNGVIAPPPGFLGTRQVLLNNWPILAQQMWPFLAGAAALLAALAALAWRLFRRRP